MDLRSLSISSGCSLPAFTNTLLTASTAAAFELFSLGSKAVSISTTSCSFFGS